MHEMSRDNLSQILRTRYRKYLRYQGNLDSVLLQRIGRNTENFAQGLEISFPLHTAGDGGHAYNSQGNLPPADGDSAERITFNYKELYKTLSIKANFRKDARGDGAAEVDPLKWRMRNFARQMRFDKNVDLHGDGSGLICDIESASSATTFVVDNLKGLRNGLRVSVLLKSNGSPGSGGVASARINVNRATKAVTLVGATLVDGAGTELNSNAALYGVYRQGSYNDAPFGLKAAVSDANPSSGNYGNVDRSLAANDWYRSTVLTGGGIPRKLTFKLIQDLVDEVTLYSEGKPNLLMCGHQVWSRSIEDMIADRRYGGKEMTLNGWATAVQFGDLPPLVRDKHCPEDTLYCLDTETFTIFQDSEGDWMQEDGAILSRIPGRAAYEAAWMQQWQLVCMSPISNGKLTDLEYTG